MTQATNYGIECGKSHVTPISGISAYFEWCPRAFCARSGRFSKEQPPLQFAAKTVGGQVNVSAGPFSPQAQPKLARPKSNLW